MYLAMGEVAPCIGHWFRIYTAFWRTFPPTCKVLPTIWHSYWVFKRSLYQATCFRIVADIVSPVNSTSTGPLSHFFPCEVSSLTRSNAVWNILMTDKAFYKSTDGSFDRSIARREGKSVSRVSIPEEQNAASSTADVVINLPSGSWIVTLRNGAIWGCSVSLCCW